MRCQWHLNNTIIGDTAIWRYVHFLLYLLADGSGSGEGSGQEAAGSGEEEVDCEERNSFNCY